MTSLTNIQQQSPASPFGAFAEWTRGLTRRLAAALERRRLIEQTVFEMDQMSDRELADFGLMRCDLPRIARETVDQRLNKQG